MCWKWSNCYAQVFSSPGHVMHRFHTNLCAHKLFNWFKHARSLFAFDRCEPRNTPRTLKTMVNGQNTREKTKPEDIRSSSEDFCGWPKDFQTLNEYFWIRMWNWFENKYYSWIFNSKHVDFHHHFPHTCDFMGIGEIGGWGGGVPDNSSR